MNDRAGERLRYVALGDSYTIGTGVGPEDRWPDQLVRVLGGADAPIDLVANLGVNGFSAADVVAVELPALDRLTPGFASLLVGVNDVVRGASVESFRSALQAILDDLGARLPVDRMVLVTTPDYTVTPAGSDYGRPAVQRAGIVRNNAILAEEGAARGISVVDIFDISGRAGADPSLVAADGLHPSGTQYALWVARIAPVVARLMAGNAGRPPA